MTNVLRSIKGRLLVSYLSVCAVGTVVLFLTVRATAPSFFQHHIGSMAGMQGTGGMMSQEAAGLDGALSRSLNEGFLIATAVALPLGVIASFLVAQQIAAPVKRLADASGRIAAGEYAERVPTGGPAELDELAGSFNAMAQALEDVERRRMELIGDVAHELRTPVTVLRGYIEGLGDGVFPANAETWAKLGDEAARLCRLVEDLEELSRAEAGQFSLVVAPVNPFNAVRTAAARLESAFSESGISLNVDAPRVLPAVAADFDRLVQILTNLLTNAVKYTSTSGSVTFAAGEEGNGVAFSVRDSGIGIAPEQLAHVFERFYRVDGSRARSSGGSGIGLTIAKALAEAMSGTLTAESAGLGKGSMFTLWLPLSK
jgi:two-component system, OmpR family, sensor histidine kinase BaeS